MEGPALGRNGRELRALQAMQRDVWGHAYYDSYYDHPVAARRAPRRARALGAATIALGAVLIVFGLAPTGANATKPNPEHKITLCHRTDSYSNPYVVITVDVASVRFEGHAHHDGPVFFPAIPKHQKWGDIIPPFDFGPHASYPGKNWDSAGMAVFNNQCALPSPPSSSTSSSSTSSSSTSSSSTSTSSTSSSSTSTPTTVHITGTTSVTSTSIAGGTTTTSPARERPLGGATTTTAPATGTPALARTGVRTTGLIIAGLALIGCGIGLTRRRRAHV
jgi:hypothetical protein